MSENRFEVIVLGLGGMGSAATYYLAKQGVKVCGIERYGVAHEWGSSHGELRAIRKAYFEHPHYIPLLERAYTLWRELEAGTGAGLFVQNGMVLAMPPGSETAQGLTRCYQENNLPHEQVTAGEAMERYPVFKLPDDYTVFVDPEGGYLHVERCIRHYLDAARSHGANLRLHTDVAGWRRDGEGIIVETDEAEIHADTLILTLGAWTGPALAELGVPLQILRKVQFWYAFEDMSPFEPTQLPVFFVDTLGGYYYGFPTLNGDDFKLADHLGGQPIDDPDQLDRALNESDEAPFLEFLNQTFPGRMPERTRFSVCMYSMSPDGHFILDTHPDHANIILAAGFSGHGYKMASAIGQALAHLATHGNTDPPIDFLRLDRFA